MTMEASATTSNNQRHGGGTTGRGERGSSRVLTKLQNSLEAGNYYEAHQMYRTLCFRYSAGRKWKDLLDLLFHGAIGLLEKGQLTSGADLAQLFAEKLDESHSPCTEATLLRIENLCSKLPNTETATATAMATGRSSHQDNQSNSSSTEHAENVNKAEIAAVIDRSKFINTVLKWGREVAEDARGRKSGHPKLHAKLAAVHWSEKNYVQARRHFMLSDDGENCGIFLIDYQLTRGFIGEVDIFLAQGVLQYLCYSQKTVADSLFNTYTNKHPKIDGKGPPYEMPLVNFLWLLLIAVEVKKLQQFTALVNEYQSTIDRDPGYVDYVRKIGELYFGVPPQRPSGHGAGGLGGGFLQNLFKSFLDDEDESDEDLNDVRASAAASSSTTTANQSANRLLSSTTNNPASSCHAQLHQSSSKPAADAPKMEDNSELD